jgi:hypothetical protein
LALACKDFFCLGGGTWLSIVVVSALRDVDFAFLLVLLLSPAVGLSAFRVYRGATYYNARLDTGRTKQAWEDSRVGVVSEDPLQAADAASKHAPWISGNTAMLNGKTDFGKNINTIARSFAVFSSAFLAPPDQ